MNHKVGIIGVGMVGAPLVRYFEEYKGYKRGRDLFLSSKERYQDDINQADVIFICVPTPPNPRDGSCSISVVESAFKKISAKGGSLPTGQAGLPTGQIGAPGGKGNKIVVIKSTVPPGTAQYFQNKYPNLKVLFNPEFLTEARAWEDMVKPDRQIVGFTEKNLDAACLVLSLLPKAPFMSPQKNKRGTSAVRITATEAEFIKYAGNIFLARKVNWANALAKVAERMGANYENIRKGMATDVRIGVSHLDVNHGNYRGFGGFCFPKDTLAFMAFVKKKGLKDVYELLKQDWKFNEELLKSQGLTIEDVSRHAGQIEEIIKNKKLNTRAPKILRCGKKENNY